MKYAPAGSSKLAPAPTDAILARAEAAVLAHELRRADKITAAGVTAQLSFLKEAWGSMRLKNFLERTGGILDAIVRHTSSDPKSIAEDIGRDNVDANGDVR